MTPEQLSLRAKTMMLEGHTDEQRAARCETADSLVHWAQCARLAYVMALIETVRFLNALPEPVAIPPVPQPSEEARRRGLLVGAVVRGRNGDIGRVIGHGKAGGPVVLWPSLYGYPDDVLDVLTVVRPAPTTREPNAEATRRGLYIGARVVAYGDSDRGEIIAWDHDGDQVIETEVGVEVPFSGNVTLAEGAS